MQASPLPSIAAICVGACVGALARWQLGVWLNPSTGIAYAFPQAFPWGTLAANLIGGYLIGVCVGVFQGLPHLDPLWRLALVTGLLGALTTFSSFSMEVVTMLQNRQLGLALLTSGTHLLGSLFATGFGLLSAKSVLPPIA